MSSNSDEASNADPDAYVGEVSSLQASSPPRPSIGVRNDDPEAQPQAHAGANRATSASSDEDSEDSEEQRENRFQGPASTWRDHTREERGLAASLDQQRANDLSVHLYNTHALKARLRDPQLAAAAKPWQSKRGWLRVDGEGKVPWHPDPHWTAWPLPASEVPRREEVFGVSPADLDGDGSYRKVEPWRPSADLASEIQALILRKGKERFRRRRWVDGKDDVSAEVPASKAQTKASDDAGPDSLREAKPAVFLRTARYQPVFLADDDKAEEITSPSLSKEQIAEIEERLDHRAAASWSSSAKDAQTSDADEENVAGNEVSAESDESDMMGGVHNDGFLLPISGTALGRGPDIKRPRRRSTDAKEMGAGKRRKMEHEEEEEEEEEGKEESELNDFK
ncbi:hypothetical protein B0A55_03644 [Friedmanniomyces simplex]|uniref:Rrn9 domain-containing protein n=1 Tax=Friedmanniomyces simplex TaxID=329884 RepID=A0A4U0XMG5_9PEZI|nr:hypothetical protein B0A55_03644 [Friedmanniomyces simplex]